MRQQKGKTNVYASGVTVVMFEFEYVSMTVVNNLHSQSSDMHLYYNKTTLYLYLEV